MSVVDALEAELAAIRVLAPNVADSALAAGALALAGGLDNADNSLTSRSMALHELRETMRTLHALTPTVEREDDLAKLRSRHAERRHGFAGSAGPLDA